MDVKSWDFVNGCHNVTGAKCHSGHSIWIEMFSGHPVSGCSVHAPERGTFSDTLCRENKLLKKEIGEYDND